MAGESAGEQSDKRLATDVLKDIETKVDLLLQYYRNLDNNVKLILSQLNSFKASQGSSTVPIRTVAADPTVVNKSNFDNRPKTNRFEQMASANGIAVEESSAGAVGYKPNVASQDEEMTDSPIRTGFQRGQRTPPPAKGGAKSAVSQVLTKSDGTSPLFLANVEILDADTGALVKQTRTGTSGRWSAALVPGSYSIHVVKRFAESNQPPIEATYKIEVPPSNVPMELNPLPLGND